MKTRVKFLKTIHGRDFDSVGVKLFVEGTEDEIGDELLKMFIDAGAISIVQPEHTPIETRETKIIAPEEPTKRPMLKLNKKDR